MASIRRDFALSGKIIPRPNCHKSDINSPHIPEHGKTFERDSGKTLPLWYGGGIFSPKKTAVRGVSSGVYRAPVSRRAERGGSYRQGGAQCSFIRLLFQGLHI